nr:hypothetical protein GCM10020092_083100 [Actinoplanes digitatis]
MITILSSGDRPQSPAAGAWHEPGTERPVGNAIGRRLSPLDQTPPGFAVADYLVAPAVRPDWI